MADQTYQDITDRRIIIDTLQEAVDARAVLTMEYPGTQHKWITYLLEVEYAKSPCLLIDRVRGFRNALERNRHREIFFEFKDKHKVPFAFKTGFVDLRGEGILVQMPTLLQRNQRRKYFRVETPAGSEISFVDALGNEPTGVLINIGGGGVAFLLKKKPDLTPGDVLGNPRLDIREGTKKFFFQIPGALVKRIEKWDFNKFLVALEFTEISEGTRKDVIGYVFERQRSILRKIGH